MKNMIKFPALVLGLLLLLTGINQKVMAQDEDISLQTFYDELSPYGSWIQDPQYGYVWRPDVDQNEFRPYYTNGHWAMTEYGNTWVSDYDWGWAPFHYGRWVTNSYNEWLWIPDTTWGPAWVNWRSGGGNYGWAPLGPSLSVGVRFNIPSFWWVFIPQSNIYYDRFPRYNWNRNYGYMRNTTIINNVYVHNRNTYYTGPRRDEIRRVTNRDVRVYSINRTDRPGRSRISNNSINMYNPRSNRSSDNRNAAPRNLTNRGEYAGTRGRTDNNNGPDRNPNNGGNRNPNEGGNRNNDNGGNRNPNNGSNNNPRTSGTNTRPDRDNNRMERPQGAREQVGAVRQRPDFGGGRQPSDQQRQQFDQQRQQQMQQRQQSDQQRQQGDQQRQQQMQQRQQQDNQRQQGDQQRQQQMQQRQQQNNERQQQMQQRQQRQEAPSSPQRVERVASPQRSESRSNNSGGDASRGGSERSGRGGGRG